MRDYILKYIIFYFYLRLDDLDNEPSSPFILLKPEKIATLAIAYNTYNDISIQAHVVQFPTTTQLTL